MKQRLSDSTYEQLKKELLDNNSSIEGLLTEQVIADRYGVSRSPARSALLRLCAEGYLRKYPQKGYVVKDIHGRMVKEKRQLRAALETGVCVYLMLTASKEEIDSLYHHCDENLIDDAATNNRQFHLSMAKLLHNEEIVNELQRLIDESAPKILDSTQEEIAKKQYVKAHRKILDAIKARDMEATVDAINSDLNMPITIV